MKSPTASQGQLLELPYPHAGTTRTKTPRAEKSRAEKSRTETPAEQTNLPDIHDVIRGVLNRDSHQPGPQPLRSQQVSPQASPQDPKAQLLKHPALWQARKLQPEPAVRSTGFDTLDAAIGGWPEAGLMELHHDATGIGELQLLLPLLRTLSQTENRWIVWINPPHLPCAPALEAAGVDLSKLLLVHPRTAEEAIWALERSLQSGTSSLTLCWFGHKALPTQELSLTQSRRLKLAAKQGNALGCLFRNSAALAQPSQSNLRLALEPADHCSTELGIRVCKRQGGWPGAELTLTLDSPPARQQQQRQALEAQLLLWRHNALNDTQNVDTPVAGTLNQETQAVQAVKEKNWHDGNGCWPAEPRVMH